MTNSYGCRGLRCLRASRGFSLVELLIVMGIFVVVMLISSASFEHIAKAGSKLIKSADSNVQGIVGLEIMRSDLEHAGYGLPWSSPSSTFVFNFDESLEDANSLAKGIDPAIFNDRQIPASVDSTKTPRAVQAATAEGPAAGAWELGRDYLVIKSTAVADNSATRKWSYLEGVSPNSSLKEWGEADDMTAGDRVITLRSRSIGQNQYRDLVAVSSSNFSYAVPARLSGKYTPPPDYQAESNDIYLVYGVSAAPFDLSFPYNRVDYYIKRPAENKMPARCAPGTGILYKANVNHYGIADPSNPNNASIGKVNQYPLLECVADMQVVFSLDTNGDGGVDLHEDEDILSSMSAEEIRSQLKEVRVYILAQNGQKDSSFTFPTSTVRVGEFGRGRAYDLTLLNGIGSDWKHYRWKLYTLVVTPKNINN